jgi:rubrerythrin
MNAIEIAIKMEKDAISFYTEAAEKISNPVGKKMFLSIAEDEKTHLRALSEIFREVDIHIGESSPMENVRTIFESMRSQMIERIQATNEELEAFRIAMEMEKEGIEFYRNLGEGAPAEKERLLFQRLVKEEEQHYQIFANTHFFLSQSGSWFIWEDNPLVEGGTPWA